MKQIYRVLFIILISITIIPFNKIKADTFNKVDDINIDSELIIGSNNLFHSEGISLHINASKIMPGDYLEKDLLIKNKSNNEFNLIMNTEELTNKNSEFYLLDKLEITLIYDDKILYQGQASEMDINKNNYVSLGKIAAGTESILRVIAKLDGSAVGNDFQNKYGVFNINFFIREENKDYNNDSNDISKLPQTGEKNIMYLVLLSATSILFGYKLIKK